MTDIYAPNMLNTGSAQRLSPSGVGELADRLTDALGRARIVREKLASVTDQMFGPRPEGVGDAHPVSDSLQGRIDELHSILTGIENHVNRL